MSVKCFWIEESGKVALFLRRHASGQCATGRTYHDARTPYKTIDHEISTIIHSAEIEREHAVPHDDSRWPTKCEHCGYEFGDADNWQIFTDTIYIRPDTGALLSLRDHVPGAMYDAWWLGDWAKGPDGRHLVAITPDGYEWVIDGPASNCTMPNDHEHRCWIRHGEPPNITVDKNGHTCQAGAGSIATPGYHGFLRNGLFT